MVSGKPNGKRIAWFSPLDGASVSAFCSRILLPILAEEFEITVFHAGPEGEFLTPHQKLTLRHYLTARAEHERKAYDYFFYNVEDCPDLNFSRMHLALMPGIVWMHDFFMTTHGPEPILNSSWTETVKRFTGISTKWPERNIEFPPAQSFAAREVAMSFVALFSNPRDLAESKRLLNHHLLGARARSFLVQHPVPVDLFKQNNLGDGLAVIGLAAKPRVESHVHQVFSALESIDFTGRIIWPVAAIEFDRATALVQEFGLEQRCQVRVGAGPEAWRDILHEISIAVHVRFSAFGQPAPELAMSLASGLPALVTDFAAGSTYPQDTVFSIRPGQYEVQEIALVLQTLLSAHQKVFVAGREFAREFHHPLVVADALRRIFSEEGAMIRELSTRWHELECEAHRELVRESLLPVLSQQSVECRPSIEGSIREQFRELGWLSDVEVQ